MMTFTERVEVAAPPDEVFWFMLEPENAPRVDPTFVYWRPRELPPRLGTHNDLKMRGPLGIPFRAVSRFTAFDPPRSMTISSVEPTWPVRLTAHHLMEATAEGGTRYTYTIAIEPRRGGSVAARLLRRSMQRAVREGSGRLLDLLGAPDR